MSALEEACKAFFKFNDEGAVKQGDVIDMLKFTEEGFQGVASVS